MRNARRLLDRRGFLSSVTMAGAAAVTPALASARPGEPKVQLAQATPAVGVSPPAAITVKSVDRVAGSAVSYAYAVKAGPFIFLNGHEGFDFEKGLAPEVEGPPGYPLSGRPPLRREADYILKRCATILKEFGADLPQTVRVDQYYTKGPAVSAYHLARFAEFGGYIPPSTSIIMDRCFTGAHQHPRLASGDSAHARAGRSRKSPCPARRFPRPVTIQPWSSNDFVFVAGNMALAAMAACLPP